MSLKVRLWFGVVAMVLFLTTAISLLYLDRQLEQLFEGTGERAEVNASLVKDFVLQRIQDKAAQVSPPPETLEESAKIWRNVIENDKLLPNLLVKALANSGLAVEIFITDTSNIVLAASTPAHTGDVAPKLEDYRQWQAQSLASRVLSLYGGKRDYAIRIPLGTNGMELFRIQVMITSELMRKEVEPEFAKLAGITIGGLGFSLLLGAIFANLFVRPLARMSMMIDRISQGSRAEALMRASDPVEFKELESKLGLLGEKVQGEQKEMTSLLDQMDLAVFMFDRNRECILANAAADKLLGKATDTIEGRTLEEIFPDSTELGAALQAAAGLDKQLFDFEVREPQRLQVSMEINGRRLMVTIRDVVSRSAIASQLEMSTRLAAINKLTGGVAHEIKNPMNAIAIHLEVLRAKYQAAGEPVPEEVGVISKEIARLDRVVKAFLDFSRPMKVEVTVLDLVRLTEEVKNLLAPQAAAVGVEIVFSEHPVAVEVMADRDLLQQGILNVASNGIESMKSGGKVELRIVSDEKSVVLEITDQGQGIPDLLRDKIFNLYYTTKPKGNGIGLAVTAKALELMGGRIEFESEVGRGTCFRLRMLASTAVVAA